MLCDPWNVNSPGLQKHAKNVEILGVFPTNEGRVDQERADVSLFVLWEVLLFLRGSQSNRLQEIKIPFSSVAKAVADDP